MNSPLPQLVNEFFLNPEVTYLNHGALGLAPRTVWEQVHEWEQKVEENPVQFLDRELAAEYQLACDRLGEFIGSPGKDLILVENATYAVNYVLQGLSFAEGDEVLITDLEYGAYTRLWKQIEKRHKVRVKIQKIPLPVYSPNEVFDALWSGVTQATKLIFFSHIASRTALCLPAKKICKAARAKGILTFVDGAHVPGQIDLHLEQLGADFYTGNCHKWLFGPRPCGFLYIHPAMQEKIEPLVISWGGESPGASGVPFRDDNVWLGTRDFTRVLSISSGIDFFEQNDFQSIRESCRNLAKLAGLRFSEQFGFPPLYKQDAELFGQMVAIQLPECDPHYIREALAQRYGIEVSTGYHHEMRVLRISLQCYNSEADINKLSMALGKLL